MVDFPEVGIFTRFRPEVFNRDIVYKGTLRLDENYLIIYTGSHAVDDWYISYAKILGLCINYNEMEIRIIQGSIFFDFFFRKELQLKCSDFFEILVPRLNRNTIIRNNLPPFNWQDYNLAEKQG